jgi:hypothetical protein
MASKALVLGTVAAALFAAPALAHHSFAMFDARTTSSVVGTVKDYEWINPHVWVHLVVPDAKTGKPVTWSFEAGSTGQLMSTGWKGDTLKAGDKITLNFHPLKDGSYGGQLLTIVLPDGKSLCQGGACRASGGAAAAQ